MGFLDNIPDFGFGDSETEDKEAKRVLNGFTPALSEVEARNQAAGTDEGLAKNFDIKMAESEAKERDYFDALKDLSGGKKDTDPDNDDNGESMWPKLMAQAFLSIAPIVAGKAFGGDAGAAAGAGAAVGGLQTLDKYSQLAKKKEEAKLSEQQKLDQAVKLQQMKGDDQIRVAKAKAALEKEDLSIVEEQLLRSGQAKTPVEAATMALQMKKDAAAASRGGEYVPPHMRPVDNAGIDRARGQLSALDPDLPPDQIERMLPYGIDHGTVANIVGKGEYRKAAGAERQEALDQRKVGSQVIPGFEMDPDSGKAALTDFEQEKMSTINRATTVAMSKLDQLESLIANKGVNFLGDDAKRMEILMKGLLLDLKESKEMGANWTEMERAILDGVLPALQSIFQYGQARVKGQDVLKQVQMVKQFMNNELEMNAKGLGMRRVQRAQATPPSGNDIAEELARVQARRAEIAKQRGR
jgi:hypothetical protein